MDVVNNERLGVIWGNEQKLLLPDVTTTTFNTCEACFTVVSIGEDRVIIIPVIIIMIIYALSSAALNF